MLGVQAMITAKEPRCEQYSETVLENEKQKLIFYKAISYWALFPYFLEQ